MNRIIIYILLLSVTLSFAQSATESAYYQIRGAFDNEQWETVITKADKFRQSYRESKFESSVVLMKAQAALKLRELATAVKEAHLIHLKFPESEFNDDARWIMAECALLSERWDDAKDHFNWILGFADDEHLRQKAQLRIDELNNFLRLQQEAGEYKGADVSDSLCIALLLPFTSPLETKARNFLHGFQARWSEADRAQLRVYDTMGDPVYAARLAAELSQTCNVCGIIGGLDEAEAAALAAIAQAEKVPFITTICGFSGIASIGRYSFQGRADFEGIGKALAHHAYTQLDSDIFGILAPRTQEGRQIAEGFKNTVEEFSGIILSEEYFYPGTIDYKEFFLLMRKAGLRLAFDDSLRLFFSMNGYIMPDTAAKVAYRIPDSEITAEDTSSIFTIFDYSDTTWVDLPRRLLEPVLDEMDFESTTGSTSGIDYSMFGSGDTTWTLTDDFLDSLWIDGHKRIRQWMIENEQEIDSLEIPIDVFDAFLIVLDDSKEIEVMAPQLARANIRSQMLGNEKWADVEAMRQVSNYVQGLIFAEPMAAVGGAEYYEFAEHIVGDSSLSVNRFHLAGERAARMMQFATARGRSAEEIRIALSQIRDLKTLSGRVTLLKEERVNRSIGLIRFYRNDFEVLER